MSWLRRSRRVVPAHLSVRWPAEHPDPGAHFWSDQILAGLRETGVSVEMADIRQPSPLVVVCEVAGEDGTDLVAFDRDDAPEIREDVAGEVCVYFKHQYANSGYEHPNVVPAGYMPANGIIYRHLPLLRAIRALRLFRWDVYCRFGLRYGGAEIRTQAHELLSARSDLRYGGSLFRYPGGPDKVPYRKYLFEIPRAKVCVDMPGAGDLCTRLVDYLAVGACVVKPAPRARLPVRLVDGIHVVYCASDLSDLGDVCAQLVRDVEQRETIARNARDFFDRYLHKRELAQYYLDEITDAQANLGRAERSRVRTVQLPVERARTSSRRAAPRMRRAATSLTRPLVIALLILIALVALPEALGDRPYDPRPTHELRIVEHAV